MAFVTNIRYSLSILSIFVATDVYALFKKSVTKKCNLNVQNKGGRGEGLTGFLNNVKKNCNIGGEWIP